ncbi:MAG: tetratricopeptide repeat protein [Candidatus Rifleibacteriota bacterium]
MISYIRPAKGFVFFLLLSLFMIPCFKKADARVLSGSKTEKKINRRVERWLKSARKDYKKGEVQEALDTYWKILEVDPEATVAYLELGEIYHELKIYNRAIELLEPGTEYAESEFAPETVCYYYCVLTRSYLAINKIGLASKALIKAARIAPRDPLPRLILGDIYMSHNRIKSAYKAYQKAIRLDPDYAPALEKLGELTTKYKDQLANVQSKKKKPRQRMVKRQVSRPKKTRKQIATQTKKQTNDSAEKSEESAMGAIEDRPLPMPGVPAKPATSQTDKSKEAVSIATEPEKKKRAKKEPAKKEVNSSQADVKADPEQIEAKISQLLAGNANQKKAAAAYLVKLGNQGLIEVEDLLFDPDPAVRTIAARTIPKFAGSFKNRVENILKDALGDPDPMVEKELQQALDSL